MKKQTRPAEPEVLSKHASQWNEQWSSLKATNPTAKFNWYQVNGRSARDWVLPELRKMNESHCSFCDSFPLEASSNEPVEHFRPKSDARFYDQAYSWTNLYYSCEFCQRAKGEKWSDLLLAPDADDYAFSEYFMFDFTTGAISPTPGISPDKKERAQTTIDLYGLDREPRRRFRLMVARNWLKSTDQEIDSWAYRNFVQPVLV